MEVDQVLEQRLDIVCPVVVLEALVRTKLVENGLNSEDTCVKCSEFGNSILLKV